jgi:hypothetical protein
MSIPAKERSMRREGLGLPTPENIEWIKILSRPSPSTLYNESGL